MNHIQSYLARMWRLVWRDYLDPGETVVRVYSWRTALIDGKCGNRKLVTCCPIRTWKERRRIARRNDGL